MRGICTSISTASKAWPAAAAARTVSSASWPSLACVTRTPQCSSMATAIIMLTALSSTISTRAPCRLAAVAAGVSAGGAATAGSGSSAQKRLPWPGTLCTPTLPPISVAS